MFLGVFFFATALCATRAPKEVFLPDRMPGDVVPSINTNDRIDFSQSVHLKRELAFKSRWAARR